MKNKKQIIINILVVVMVLLAGTGIGFLFAHRNNIAEYDYPTLSEEETDYGESVVSEDKQPTPNVKVDDSVKQKELTDNITDLTFEEFKNLFKSSNKSLVVIVKDGCGYCARFEPVLEETMEEMELKMYRLNTTTMTTDEKIELADYVYLDGTPTTYVIQNGSVIGALEGSKSKEILSSFIELFYLR